MELLAGHLHAQAHLDGTGAVARFTVARRIASDGAGRLYVADDKRVRKVQLPECLRGTWAAVPLGSDGEAGSQVAVTSLPFEAADVIWGLAHIPSADGSSGGSLVFATSHALYRVALGLDGAPETAAQPELLAGNEAEGSNVRLDGNGPAARFSQIGGIVADATGAIYASCATDAEFSVRKITPAGNVTTLISWRRPCAKVSQPYILSSGHLAVNLDTIPHIFDCRLPAKPLLASAAPPAASTGAPPARTLSSDLGALLDRQPDGTADITLMVGDRAFPVHRALLAARSDYFRQRFEGGFADGGAQQLSLPDADPEAFALVLQFIYTGRAALPELLAPAVAELADRLLLPELCREAQARVLADVRAETVVERLLWAESRGAAFAPLLADLKTWYLEHEDEVVDQAQPSLKRLSESPDLVVQLLVLAKRQRLR